MTVAEEYLRNKEYFLNIKNSDYDTISKLFFKQNVKRGEMVLLEGEPGEALYFVVSGMVKLFKTSGEGKEQILFLVGPGESFNDISAFDGGPNLASAQAVEAVDLCGIRKTDFEFVLRNYPQVVVNANNVLTKRIRVLTLLIEDLSFKHVIGRVAGILLKYAGDGTGPKIRLTQQEMAAMAGTAREVVGRSLKMLESDGAIRLDHHRIVISDKEMLQNMIETFA